MPVLLNVRQILSREQLESSRGDLSRLTQKRMRRDLTAEAERQGLTLVGEGEMTMEAMSYDPDKGYVPAKRGDYDVMSYTLRCEATRPG